MPYLMGALTWLREEIQYIMGIDVQSTFIPDDFESESDLRIIFHHSETAYKRFLAGDDDYEETEEELLESQLFASQGVETLEKAAEENIRLRQELELLQEKENKIPALKDQEL